MADTNTQPPDKRPANEDASYMGAMLSQGQEIGALMGAQCRMTATAAHELALDFANYFQEVCLDKDGNMKMITSNLKMGEETYTETVPVVTFLPMPVIEVKESTFECDLEITTSKVENDKSNVTAGGSLDVNASANFLFGSVGTKIHAEAKYTSSSDRTHKQDSSCKIHNKITLGPGETPIGITKYLERVQSISTALTDAQLKKITDKDTKPDAKPDQ